MRDTENDRDIGRGRSRLTAGIPMWDSIPGPQDHNLSWRQMLNHWATQVPQQIAIWWENYKKKAMNIWFKNFSLMQFAMSAPKRKKKKICSD